MSKHRLLFFCVMFLFAGFFIAHVFADETANVSVTATVPPQISDFQYQLVSTDGYTTVPQNTTLSYKIIYGAQQSAAFTTTTTIVADWSSDQTSGGTDILNYIQGSATHGYGNASPVVDLINKTITWTISLPNGVTNQSITFQLKTNGDDTYTTAVPFTIKVIMSNQYVSLSPQTLTQTYKYAPSTTLTPTTQPSTSATPTPSLLKGVSSLLTPTPSPSTAPSSLLPNSISLDVVGITQSTATFLITTKEASLDTVAFGQNQIALTNRLKTDSYDLTHSVSLENLQPDTSYFFQVTAVDQTGNAITSDLFTFHTALPSQPPSLADAIINITSNNAILVTNSAKESTQPKEQSVALVNQDSSFDVFFKLSQSISIKTIQAIVRNTQVLGANTMQAANSEDVLTAAMIEESPNVYIAHINGLPKGNYDIYVHVADIKGNIIEQKITEVRIISPLTVYDIKTHRPIDDVRLLFLVFDMTTHQFLPLPPYLSSSIKNPSYTDTKGTVSLNLPEGQYEVIASAFSYDQEKILFVLGSRKGQNLPTIYLHKNPTNIANYLRYIRNSSVDLINSLILFFQSLSETYRFFNIMALAITGMAIFLTLLFFSFKTHISLVRSFHFLSHSLSHTLNQTAHQEKYICGKILEDGHPVSKTLVELFNSRTHTILVHTHSNKAGVFYIPRLPSYALDHTRLLISKDGYVPKEIPLRNQGFPVLISFDQHLAKSVHAIHLIFSLFESFCGSLFESFAIFSFIVEFFYLSIFGFLMTLPFFLLSFYNIVLWLLYLREKRRESIPILL